MRKLREEARRFVRADETPFGVTEINSIFMRSALTKAVQVARGKQVELMESDPAEAAVYAAEANQYGELERILTEASPLAHLSGDAEYDAHQLAGANVDRAQIAAEGEATAQRLF